MFCGRRARRSGAGAGRNAAPAKPVFRSMAAAERTPLRYTCAELRALDERAVQFLGMPSIVLMENAARQVAHVVLTLRTNPQRGDVVILCGPGNNGGDGFAAARHLLNAGVETVCVLASAPEKCRGDAAINLGILTRMGATPLPATTADGPAITPAAAGRIAAADVIVDALLGTGSRGAPRGEMAELIRLANATPHARRVAVDIPSGLDGDSGVMHDPCFVADTTVTFVAEKLGFAAPAARAVLGRVVVADIGIAPRFLRPARTG